jgi:predicted RNA-binding Zn ribbon-like protein
VSRLRGNVSPRYDVPKAAPEPLRQVQLFLNTVDLHSEADWLSDWLAERGGGDPARARTLREALRALVLANNGYDPDEGAVALVNAAAARVQLTVDAGNEVHLAARNAVDEVVAVALAAMLDGSWRRLKACRHCRWSFYDYSPNRSATWCSMQICGNRDKTRAYRRRRSDGREARSG